VSIERYLLKQNFNPDLLGLFINPFYFARRGLYKNINNFSKEIKGSILDVGCGRKPYRDIFKVDSYIGMDLENEGHDHSNENIDVYYDGIRFPFEENTFDAIFTSQVFEHVFNPGIFLKEIHKVLKSGGKLLLTVPFVWDEHEQPNDYARYSSFGLKHVIEINGFKIIRQTKSINDIRVIFQIINMYIYKNISTNNKCINSILTMLFISWSNVLGVLLSLILPKNNDLYLDNVLLAEKV
jgi:SAM-dependent methyltransferase